MNNGAPLLQDEYAALRLFCFVRSDLYRDVRGPFGSKEANAASREAASIIGRSTGLKLKWDVQPSAGGAGEQWIPVLTLGIAALTLLLDAPKKASEAYDAIARLLRAARRRPKRDWDVGVEVCALLCAKELRKRVRSPVIISDAVRVMEDGTQVGMWSDLPTGVHVIVMPEARSQKTYIFAVDSSPKILGTMVINELTTDARLGDRHQELCDQARAKRRRSRTSMAKR